MYWINLNPFRWIIILSWYRIISTKFYLFKSSRLVHMAKKWNSVTYRLYIRYKWYHLGFSPLSIPLPTRVPCTLKMQRINCRFEWSAKISLQATQITFSNCLFPIMIPTLSQYEGGSYIPYYTVSYISYSISMSWTLIYLNEIRYDFHTILMFLYGNIQWFMFYGLHQMFPILIMFFPCLLIIH